MVIRSIYHLLNDPKNHFLSISLNISGPLFGNKMLFDGYSFKNTRFMCTLLKRPLKPCFMRLT